MAEINERYEGNYLVQADFPLDSETLEYIAQNRRMAEMLGAIAGDRVILNGCGGDGRDAGYVFVKTRKRPRGEVMWYEGSSSAESWCHVVEESVSVTSDGHHYAQAYSKRRLAAGTGAETYEWSSFTVLDGRTNTALASRVAELETALSGLRGVPVGTVEMWAGGEIPDGYLLCDGSDYSSSEYSALSAALGGVFDTAPDKDGEAWASPGDGRFRVPDLRGRFIVGQTGSGDYAMKGTAGGEKGVTLTEEQIPSHTHNMEHVHDISHTHQYTRTDWDQTDWDGGSHGGTVQKEVSTGEPSNRYSGNALDKATRQAVTDTGTRGGDQPHENRPPYYVLAYIIKAKS